MKAGFLNSPDDVQWLKDTHIKGVPLPTQYAGFKSYVLQGNEDSPHAVNLYEDENPHYLADYFRILFVNDPPVKCIGQVYNGRTDQPR